MVTLVAASATGITRTPGSGGDRRGRDRGAAALRPPGAVVLVLLVAAVLRLGHLGAPPTDFHVTRQYNDVLLAHSFYADVSGNVSARDRRIATLDRPPILEPPVLESTTVGVDLLLGHETLVFPRLVSIWAWVLSGLTLWAIGRRFLGRIGVTVAVGLFELLPFMVVATRGFQPDPLAVAAMLLAVLMSLRWADRPSTGRLVAASSVAGIAVLLKSDFAPFVVGAQCAAAWMTAAEGLRNRIRGVFAPRQAAWLAVAVLPSAIWTTVFFSPTLSLSQRVGDYFIAHYLLMWGYWTNLWGELTSVFGVAVLGMAAVGLLLARGRLRILLVASLPAYILFAVAFDYRVATHSYYQLPFAAFVALAAGHSVEACVGWVRARRYPALIVRTMAAALLAFAVLFVLLQDRLPPTSGGRAEVVAARTVGAALCHPLHVVFVDVAYGLPLEYHGDMAGSAWPSAGDFALEALRGQARPPASTRLAALRAGGSRYVFSTDRLTRIMQPDLAHLLAAYPVVLSGPSFQVWDTDAGAPSPCDGGPG